MADGTAPRVRRYLFETSFDPEEIERRAQLARQAAEAARAAAEPPPPPPPPPPPTFSAEELAAARAEAYASGLEAGRQEAMASIERVVGDALQALAPQAAALVEAQRAVDDELVRDAAEVALAIVRKMLPEYTRKHGLAEIEAMIRECLARMLDEPRLVIRVSDAVLDPVQSRVAEMARSAGHEGAIIVMADPDLGPADAKIEWADGGAERISARIWSDIEAAVARIRGDGSDAATEPAGDRPARPARRRAKSANTAS